MLLLVQVLCNLYTKTLSVLQRMPREAAYRRQIEQIVQQRLQVVQAEASVPAIENKIGCGQVEELIDQVRRLLLCMIYDNLDLPPLCCTQAERELSLAHKMEDWQPWDALVSEPPPNQWKWP